MKNQESIPDTEQDSKQDNRPLNLPDYGSREDKRGYGVFE